jgi:hypothetical protein
LHPRTVHSVWHTSGPGVRRAYTDDELAALEMATK